MNVNHITTIHATCPLGCWDYYRVTYEPAEFVTVEDFQESCDVVRGKKMYQEELTNRLLAILPAGKITTVGMHGSNTQTTCQMEWEE